MEVDIRVTDHLYYTSRPPYTMPALVVSHRASDETCLFKNQVTERNHDNYQFLDNCKIVQLHDNCIEQETSNIHVSLGNNDFNLGHIPTEIRVQFRGHFV